MGRTPRIQKFTWNDDGTPNFGMPSAAGEPLVVPSRDGGKWRAIGSRKTEGGVGRTYFRH